MAAPVILPHGPDAVTQAARLILAGQPVALPTETVYGLAADATSGAAVAAIYAAKGRPAFNPLIVHVADRAMAERLALFSPLAARLADHFWPGPLTLVLPAVADSPIASLATAGLATVALRCPAHSAMRAVIAAAGRPLAAPSANRSGSISPTSAAHVQRSLGDRVALIVDAGPAACGIESTIVAVRDDRLWLLRPGPVTAADIAEAAGIPVEADEPGDMVVAPGQLASHYCPDKPLRLNADAARPGEYFIGFGPVAACDRNLSPSSDLTEAAANLFGALHEADAGQCEAIAVAFIPATGLGAAINDRLSRAAVRG